MQQWFRPGWKISIFTFLLLPVLYSLGSWQVDRGDEKRALIEEFMQQLGGLPTPAEVIETDVRPQNFARLRVIGHFTEEVFLLDNQIRQGQVGYWVVQVLAATHGERYLVNRGFVAAQGGRDTTPQFNTPNQLLTLTGVVWPETGLIPVWQDQQWQPEWPLRIQRMDIENMARLTAAQPYELRLEAGQEGVLQAAPLDTTLDDAKHNGYAATWFGLALVLFVGFIVIGLKNAQR